MIYPLKETRPNLHFRTGIHVKQVTLDEYVPQFTLCASMSSSVSILTCTDHNALLIPCNSSDEAQTLDAIARNDDGAIEGVFPFKVFGRISETWRFVPQMLLPSLKIQERA